MTEDFAKVTVKEATHDDAGHGIARMSIEVVKRLGLVSGDIIEILGKKKAAVLIWPVWHKIPVTRSFGLVETSAEMPAPVFMNA
ncbi:MAG: hypothetical protein WCF90_08480 [Methanomicrobiales archaeon]